jgi:hypothetical protein
MTYGSKNVIVENIFYNWPKLKQNLNVNFTKKLTYKDMQITKIYQLLVL